MDQSLPTQHFARKWGSIFLALCCVALHASAQSDESETVPALGKFEPQPPPPLMEPYVVSKLMPNGFLDWTRGEKRWFQFKLGMLIIADYNAFHQDEVNLDQVGRQDDQWDDRSVRIKASGTLGEGYKVGYLASFDYKGFDTEPTELWRLTDLSLYFPLGSPATKLTLGKTKETFGYEMVGDPTSNPQQERVLNPFFVSRSIGLKLNHVFGQDQRMTATVGIFNDLRIDDIPFAESGTDITARVTGLVWDDKTGKSFLHLGAAGRYAGADENTMRYKAKPESNVTDPFLDTGDMIGDHATHLGLEGIWNKGPFSVISEYNRAWVSSSTSQHPQFSAYYLMGSWFLTGETRPYDRTVGYTRRIMPESRWGALELVARFSHEDLDSGPVKGGSFDKTYLGLNWWATRSTKIGLGWGHTWLNRFDHQGEMDSIQLRLQWAY